MAKSITEIKLNSLNEITSAWKLSLISSLFVHLLLFKSNIKLKSI